MNKTSRHAIETMANNLHMEGKHITIVLRSEENASEIRPNAFFLTRGKNGWTKCTQDAYYFIVGSIYNHEGLYILKNDRLGEVLQGYEGSSSYHRVEYREYTDDEIIAIASEIENKGVTSTSEFGGSYKVNE